VLRALLLLARRTAVEPFDVVEVDGARVEIRADRLDTWLAIPNLRALTNAVRGAGFARVSVDLAGFRSGSLNVIGAAAGA